LSFILLFRELGSALSSIVFGAVLMVDAITRGSPRGRHQCRTGPPRGLHRVLSLRRHQRRRSSRQVDVANELAKVVEDRKLYAKNVKGKRFVAVSGWQLLGHVCSVTAVVVDTQPVGGRLHRHRRGEANHRTA
jgi:hypothetical protein